MRRTTTLSAAAVAAVTLLAGCTHDAGTTIGAAGAAVTPAATTPAATTATTAAAPAASGPTSAPPPARPVAAVSAAAPTRTAAPLVAAPLGYGQQPVGTVPQYPTGYADVETWVPNGSHVSRVRAGDGWRSGTGTTDFRDESRRLLVRFRYEPATGSTDGQSLANVVGEYRALPGAHVTVTSAAHPGRLNLLQAEWTVDVPVGGTPRHALVSAWVLNRQVISVYASAPRASAGAARALYAHAVQLSIWTHIDEDGDY